MDILTEDTLVNTELFEQERAIAALHAEGVWFPDPFQVRDRMEANRAAKAAKAAELEASKANAQARAQPEPSEPMQAPPAPAKRKRGRPPRNPLWLADLADNYARGLPMLRALRKVGKGDLSEGQRKNIYRWEGFRQLVSSLAAKYGIREYPHSRRGNREPFD